MIITGLLSKKFLNGDPSNKKLSDKTFEGTWTDSKTEWIKSSWPRPKNILQTYQMAIDIKF